MDASPTNAARAARVAPSCTLRDLFGERTAYVPRLSPAMPGRSNPARAYADFRSGAELTVAGGAPYLASTGVVTPPALALLEEAGVPADAQLLPYRSLDDHPAILRQLVERGAKLAPQHVFPVGEVKTAVVRPLLLGWLADKASLPELVPAGWLPKRRVVRGDRLPPADALVAQGPVVLATAGSTPSEGGWGVFLADDAAAAEDARRALAEERAVLVEERLPVARTLVVHATVHADGRVVHRGTVEDASSSGRWSGTWLDAAAGDLPADALEAALATVKAAATRGYVGAASVDVAMLEGGRPPRILDADFRATPSTAAVWLREGLERDRGVRAAHLRAFTVADATFASLLRVARAGVARGSLVPLCLFDPDATATSGVPRMAALLVGASREAIVEEARRFAADGLR